MLEFRVPGRAFASMQKQGFGISEGNLENNWKEGTAYHGINTPVTTPEGYTFELQFHTPESHVTKESNHADFDIARDPDKSPAERHAADVRMATVFSKVERPPNVMSIGFDKNRPAVI